MSDPLIHKFTVREFPTHFIVFLAFLVFQFSFTGSTAQDKTSLNNITWTELQEIPPGNNMQIQPGLASPFSGVSNGALIVIGGCNFPDEPVHEGGKKKYYADIFVLESLESSWERSTIFPTPVAYSASVSIEDGLLCIGGKNNEAEFNDVKLLTWNPDLRKIEIEQWPRLPFTMSQHTAALVDNKIYIAGGTVNGALSNKLLRLDLSKKGTDTFLWEELPDFPGPARLQSVGIGQNVAEEAHFYLISGSSFPTNAQAPSITKDLSTFQGCISCAGKS